MVVRHSRAWCKWCNCRIQQVFGSWELVSHEQVFSTLYAWTTRFTCAKAPNHKHHPAKETDD